MLDSALELLSLPEGTVSLVIENTQFQSPQSYKRRQILTLLIVSSLETALELQK